MLFDGFVNVFAIFGLLCFLVILCFYLWGVLVARKQKNQAPLYDFVQYQEKRKNNASER